MGKCVLFDIIIENNPQLVFFAGQSLGGYVKISMKENIKIHGIKLKIKGKAKTEWTEGSGDDEVTRIGKEKYFSHDTYLLGASPDKSEELTLHSGDHVFPFNFHLPPNLPSSFEKKHGYVRYSVKVKVKRTGFHSDYTLEKPFTVLHALDLNLDPEALRPAQMQESKMICCLCCATGPVTAVFRIDRKGYVAGETILLNAEIQNQSNRLVHNTEVKLRMFITFFAGHEGKHTRTEYATVTKLEHGSIEPGESGIWSNDGLVIPPVPPSYLEGCNLIDIRYQLVLKVDIEDTPFDLEVPLDVIIGTIPLRFGTYGMPPLPPSMMTPAPPPVVDMGDIALEHKGEPPVIDTQPGSAMPSAPPPSYQECVFGPVTVNSPAKGEEEPKAAFTYTPIYTYYNYGPSQ